MRLIEALLILILFVSRLTAQQLADCIPMSLQYLGDKNNYYSPADVWIKACHTDKSGTDLINMVSAWNTVTNHKSKLTCIYVSENLLISNFKPEVIQRGLTLDTHYYLWVGMHGESTIDSPNGGSHCAVVVFHETSVHMINPNAKYDDGRFLEEDMNYPMFLSHTMLVFDVDSL